MRLPVEVDVEGGMSPPTLEREQTTERTTVGGIDERKVSLIDENTGII